MSACESADAGLLPVKEKIRNKIGNMRRIAAPGTLTLTKLLQNPSGTPRFAAR